MSDDLKLILAVAAAAGAMYGLVTRPLMALVKAEMGTLRAEMGTLRAEFRGEMAALKAELKLEFKTELGAVEKRLNERIDAWVIRR